MAITIQEIPTPIYTTATAVKAATDNTDLQALSDEDVNSLIVQAENLIDFYVGFWEKYCIITDGVDGCDYLRTIFPRLEDFTVEDDIEDPFIPSNINQATILLVEILFEKQSDGADDISSFLGDAESVKIGDFSVKRRDSTPNATDTREALSEFLGSTTKGGQVLNYISEYQNLAITRL